MPNVISEELRQFLQQRLASVEQIEIVLLLKSDPSRSWLASEVASRLGSAPESAAMRLFLLASAGLIFFEASGVPRYRYAGDGGATDALLNELAAVYASDPEVVTAVVEAPAPPDPLRSFSDAFKLKR